VCFVVVSVGFFRMLLCRVFAWVVDCFALHRISWRSKSVPVFIYLPSLCSFVSEEFHNLSFYVTRPPREYVVIQSSLMSPTGPFQP